MQAGTKSMFNKEKWLPATQELPFAISHYCCSVMKKGPMKKYARATKRKPIIGTLKVAFASKLGFDMGVMLLIVSLQQVSL